MLHVSCRTPLAIITLLTLSELLTACPECGQPLDVQPDSCDEALNAANLVEGAPSYKDWKEANAQPMPNGTWVFEGDIIIRDEDQLYASYLQTYRMPTTETAGINFRGIVDCDGKYDNVWNVSDKLDLTYCFGSFPTGNLEPIVRGAIEIATLEWERAGDVNFVHVPMTAAECNCIFPEDGCGTRVPGRESASAK